MPNQSSGQNNPQRMGANITGVNAGDAAQKNAQALSQAGQSSTAGTGMTSSTAGSGGATSNSAGMGGAASNTAGMGGATSSTGYGATSGTAGYGAAANAAGGMGAATSMAGSAGGQNNPQKMGANITGVNPGDAAQKNAQSLSGNGQSQG